MPFTLLDAMRGALMFLSFENLPKEDRPPRRIWGNPDKIAAFFDAKEENPNERVHIEGPVERNAAADLLISD